MLGVPEVIKIFTDSEYWGGTPLIYIVIMGYYFVYLYTFPANFQFYSKQTKFIAMGTITAALVNIGLNFVFIQYIGMYGAALATLISYIVLFSMHFMIVKFKFKHKDFPFIYNIYGIAAAAAAWGLSYLLLDYFIIRWMIILVIIAFCGGALFKIVKEM